MEDWKKTLTDILQQEVTQEAMAEGNKTPEQEAVDFIEQELSKAREEGFTRDELRVLQILLEESDDWQEEKIYTLFDGDITTEVLEKIKSKLKDNK